jgi:hypothetical protein
MQGWLLELSRCWFVYEGMLNQAPTAKPSPKKPTVLCLDNASVFASAGDYGTKSKAAAPFSVQLNVEESMDVYLCLKSPPKGKGQKNKFYLVLEFTGSCPRTATRARVFAVSTNAYFVGHHKRPHEADDYFPVAAPFEADDHLPVAGSSSVEVSTATETDQTQTEDSSARQGPLQAQSKLTCNVEPNCQGLPKDILSIQDGTLDAAERFDRLVSCAASPPVDYQPDFGEFLILPHAPSPWSAEVPGVDTLGQDAGPIDGMGYPTDLSGMGDIFGSEGGFYCAPLVSSDHVAAPQLAATVGEKRRRASARSPSPDAKRARLFDDDSDDQSGFCVLPCANTQ